eukprot:jgi/Mesvir1/13400/Mv16487-RA.1
MTCSQEPVRTLCHTALLPSIHPDLCPFILLPEYFPPSPPPNPTYPPPFDATTPVYYPKIINCLMDAAWAIRGHLLDAINDYPGLSISADTYTHNNGSSARLLLASGTIPMYYNGTRYNVPLSIWLTDDYPRRPPTVLVTPTSDMTIRPMHPHVDLTGLVDVPYLREWVFPASTLVDLCKQLSARFGENPPLCLRWSQRDRAPANPRRGGGGMAVGRAGSGSGSVGAEDPSSAFRRHAVQYLTKKLHTSLAEYRASSQRELESLYETEALLQSRRAALERGLDSLRLDKERLEAAVAKVNSKKDSIENWLRINDRGVEEVVVDDIFVVEDPLSQQLLDAAADDLAIDDTLDALEAPLQEHLVPLEEYLTHVKRLTRQQFMARALWHKIRKMQMATQLDGPSHHVVWQR